MKFDRRDLDKSQLLDIYKALLKPRMIEEKMLILLRQNRISKWFSGIGQEAISTGATLAMDAEEYILPMHRNLSVFTTRKVPFHRLFAQFQGKLSGFTKGRDRSFHFGSKAHKIVGMISHLGAQMGVADGIALANKLGNTQQASLVFTGDGGTSEGDFHEALNIAAVWNLPVIFMIEHNGYGLSTPNHEQFRCKQLSDKGIGYGIEAVQIDGNNVLEVYHTVKKMREKVIANSKPVIIEAMTFRMRGHEEASGTAYIPNELFEEWGKKDPVKCYQSYLINEEKILTEAIQNELESSFKIEINEGLELAFAEDIPTIDTEREIQDVFAPSPIIKDITQHLSTSTIRFIDAISDGLKQCMEKYPQLILMGQDIAEYGGVFKITKGFVEMFGKERVRNTPLCESAIIGASLGLSIQGYKAMVEMQFADFVSCGFNQIVNNLAKSHYRWGQNADVVIRMPTGGSVGAGPFHSQSNEAWFTHVPGLKIVYPSSPSDAKGLLITSIEDPNPIMYFEHKALYRSLTDEVPNDYYQIPIGKANLVQEGKDISLITYGMGVHWAKEITEELQVSADILDLRSLLPWDKEAVANSVQKTNKVMVFHEDSLTGGLAGEIAAWIAEHCFEYLDAPVMREGALDTPIPFAKNLESNYLPKDRIRKKLLKLLNY